MEEVQEQKFVCKFCNKSCFSGKSLGGHMRVHLALISAAKKNKEKAESNNFSNMNSENGGDDHGDCGIEDHSKNGCKVSAEQSNSILIQEEIDDCNINLGSEDQDSYDLRENPKKSWKISDLRTHRAPKKGNLCKECGKRFPSSRALAGHMRTHSMKGKNQYLCKECSKGFHSTRALYGHMKSHSKRSRVSSEYADGLSEFDIDCPRKKRSVIKYKLTPNLSFSSSSNAASGFNEVEEVEAVALCLMMLSRGVRNWDEFNSPLESTGNAVELNSFLQSKEFSKVAADDSQRDVDEVDEEKNSVEKMDPCISGSVNCVSEPGVSEINEFDSEFVNDNAKKAELEVSVDELPLSEMFKKPRRADVSAIQLDDNKITRVDSTQVEPAKDQIMVLGIDQVDSELLDSDRNKKLIFLAHDPLLEGKSSEMLKFDDTASEIFKDSVKKREYKCKTCDKIFPSYQALGGHSNRHKIISSSSALSTEISLLSDNEYYYTTEQESAGMVTGFEFTKSKEHECPVCFKVFSTGQALGGHKRAHYAGQTESRFKENSSENHELHDIKRMFGLNVVVTSHPEARGDDGHRVWWAGHGHDREPLVISN